MSRRFFVMLTLLAAWLVHTAPVAACSVCQGDPSSDLVQGAKSGVLVMVAVTYGLLFCMAGLVVTWFVKARRNGQSL